MRPGTKTRDTSPMFERRVTEMEISMSPFIRTVFTVCLLLSILATPTALSSETSILLLPNHIEAPDGRVSLFADYESIQGNGRVPVYLVNKSAQDLVLNTQDGDIYLKLQYKDSDGNWVRAQPHGYSWCGNSYVTRTIPTGHYLLVSGYQPINGVARTVRYRLYSQEIEVVSNTGDGVVADFDIKRASSDVMSLREGTFEHVSRIALSDMPVENKMDHMRDLRGMAIRELASDRFDAEESRQVLLRVRERIPEMNEAVDRAIQMLNMRLAESGKNSI